MNEPGLRECAHVVIRHWELYGQRGFNASIQYLKRVVDRLDRAEGLPHLDETVLEVRPSLVRAKQVAPLPQPVQVISDSYAEVESWRGLVDPAWGDIVKGMK